MNKITVIRHPESEANGNLETHIIAGGGIDVPPSAYGYKSVGVFGEYYRGQFDGSIVVSSPMHRCTPLTDTICTQAVHALYTDFRLQERDFGVYTGRTKRQMLDLFQSDNPKDPAGENFSEWMDREGLGFESNSVLKTRIAACIHDAIDRFPGRDVILVTHTGIMRSIISLKTGIAEKDINDTYNIKRIDNLSMSQFEYDGGIRKTTMINHIPIELVETLRQLKLTM